MKIILLVISLAILSGCTTSSSLTQIDVAASDDCWVGEPCLIIDESID